MNAEAKHKDLIPTMPYANIKVRAYAEELQTVRKILIRTDATRTRDEIELEFFGSAGGRKNGSRLGSISIRSLVGVCHSM
jgi:hypothetical protein